MLTAILSLVGVLVGFWLGRKFSGGKSLAALSARFEESTREREEIRRERDEALQRAEELNRKVGGLESLRNSYQEQINSQLRDLDAMREKISKEIELAAGKALEKNALQFQERAEKGVGLVLNPLKEKIQDFEKKSEERYVNQSKDVHALKEEIKRIVDSSERISKGADALSKALRGEQKTQGDWGEMQVETLLEASGLRKGEEYTAQGIGLHLKDEDGRLQKPDYLINLPQGKHLILDSKVSLSAWMDYCQADSEEMRREFLGKTVASVRSHIDELSSKHYPKAQGLKTPDFVLMFVSPEGALLAALKESPNLFEYAWNQSIVIVGPSTAFAALKTVAQLWKSERQTKNALEISKEAGALHDGFVSVLEALKDLESALDKAQEKREEVFNRMKQGKGNLIRRIENLRKLGAKTAKQISGDILDLADTEESSLLTASPPQTDS